MDKEKRYNLIMKNARRLKQEVGTALSLQECKSIIEDSFNDGFEFKLLSEPTTEADTSEKANDLIPDVSDMFSFGDIVEAKCTATGRYIGKGKCVYISAMTNERCVDNVKEKCDNTYDLPVVDDNELENYR